MNQLRIGVVGAGGIAKSIHLPALSLIPEAQLCAVCDLVSDRAQAAAQAFGIPKAYASYHDMLADEKLDAVYVLVQPDALFRVASDCLIAGKHVFMEKPMGITYYQAQALKEQAAQSSRLLHVGFNRRYIPLVEQVVAKMRELTTIHHVEGRFYKNSTPVFYGGCASAFMCDVIHVIDLLCHLAKSETAPASIVRAATLESVHPQTGVAEAWYSSMEFASGMTGCVRSHYRTGGRVHEFELHGDGASAYINLGFGGAACTAKILYGGGEGFSLSSSGVAQTQVLEFDGLAIAESNRYEVYYGYHAEDRIFVLAALENPTGGDPQRAAQDCASMLAAEKLMAARVTA